MATKEAAKELASRFRWCHALRQYRAPVVAERPKVADTTMSVQHAWEKYDFLQTHLLLRESIMPTIARNPEIMDPDVDSFPMKYLDLQCPVSSALKAKE